MAKGFRKKNAGGFPYVPVVFSLTVTLFVLGLMSMLFLYGKKITDHLQENIEIQVYLHHDVTGSERDKLLKTIAAQPFTLRRDDKPAVSFVGKDEAAKKFIKETGENFLQFLGDNPLRDAYRIKIKPEYADAVDLKQHKRFLESQPGVYEAAYREDLIKDINNNLKKITIALGVFAFSFLIILVTLISNTVKLALFSQRFLIRSMQLVGATSGFIRAPFIKNALVYGLFSGVVAGLLLTALSLYADNVVVEINTVKSPRDLPMVVAALVLGGMLLSTVFTYRSVNKYLKMSLDELY